MPDRAALVTGAASGIGIADAIAHVLGEEALALTVAARRLRTSPRCVVPEIVFQRPGEAL